MWLERKKAHGIEAENGASANKRQKDREEEKRMWETWN